MKILAFGTYDVRSHPRVAVLIEGLRQHGNIVVELNRPLDIGTSGRVDALKNIGAAVSFLWTLIARWASLLIGSFGYRGKRAADALLVGYLGHFDVLLARTLFPTKRILLDHLIFAADTAKDRNLDGGIKSKLLKLLDDVALLCADDIIVDTTDHLDMVPERYRSKVVVVPVGAPDDWFTARKRRARVSEGRPSIIFFGLFTPLQGSPTIAAALKILDQRGVSCEVTLVGDGQDAAECRGVIDTLTDSVQVTWTDWVNSRELPDLVASHDICLGIFGTSGKAHRVVPNKAYQGMAAGCALITSDTPVQRKMLGAARFVHAGDPTALANELESLITSPELLENTKRDCGKRADEAFYAGSVTADLEERLR